MHHSAIVSQIIVFVTSLSFLAGCDKGPWREQCVKLEQPNPLVPTSELVLGTGQQLFDDATATLALHHVHDLIGVDDYYDSIAGGGVAVEDFDRDGDLDIILTGGTAPVGYFLNEGSSGFVECASPAGLAMGSDWTLGVSAADYDNDGDRDILLLNDGKNRLLNNQGDGSFVDVTTVAGLAGNERSAAASWADIDRDGHLDVLISNLAEHFQFFPTPELEGDRSKLYRNNGDGTFTDMSSTLPAGDLPIGSSYISPLLDFNGDQNVDLLLTQEFGMVIQRNQIYQNLGPTADGAWVTWENQSETAGLRHPEAAMGAAIFDLNGDSLPEIFLTNLLENSDSNETLYFQTEPFIFEDRSSVYGVNGLVSSEETGLYRTSSWGALNLDFNNDGYEDLYTVYGHHQEGDEMWRQCPTFIAVCENQPNALYQNENNSRFSQLSGSGSEDHGMGRGAAAADINGDGCLDIISVNLNEPSRLLLNRCDYQNNSAIFELEGTTSNRDAVGAVLAAQTENNPHQTKYVTAGSTSVHSSQPYGVHIGTGTEEVIESLTVHWPSGITETFENIPTGKDGTTRYTIIEGTNTFSPYIEPSENLAESADSP